MSCLVNSQTKGLVSLDGTQQQRKEMDRSAELCEGGWRIVEREKFTGYVRRQIKLKEEARRRRTSGRLHPRGGAGRMTTPGKEGERDSARSATGSSNGFTIMNKEIDLLGSQG